MSEEALFVFEAQDVNLEWYRKVAGVVQKAAQCCGIISDVMKKKKRERYYADITRSSFSKG